MMDEKLKITPAMKRILEREKKLSTRDEFKGEKIVFSDFFINAMKSVPSIKIDDFVFYYYAYQTEMIDQMNALDIIFEYHAEAREIKEVRPWHEIYPKIARVNCGAYTLIYNGSKFMPVQDHFRVIIHYRIQKNEIPEKVIEKELKLKEEIITTIREKREVKHGKS
jgi:hypothetical protein